MTQVLVYNTGPGTEFQRVMIGETTLEMALRNYLDQDPELRETKKAEFEANGRAIFNRTAEEYEIELKENS